MGKERIRIRDREREERQEITLLELARRVRELEVEIFGEDKGAFPNEQES